MRLPTGERADTEPVVVRGQPAIATCLAELLRAVDGDRLELSLYADALERAHLSADRREDREGEEDVRAEPPFLPVAQIRKADQRVRRGLAGEEDPDPEEALRVAQGREHGELAQQREERGLARVACGEPHEEHDDDERADRLAIGAAKGDEREERRPDPEAPWVFRVAVLHLERLHEEPQDHLRRMS